MEFVAEKSENLQGERTTVPGDKSLSHRALILAAAAIGTTRIRNLLASEDVAATATALRQLGTPITEENGETVIHGGRAAQTPSADIDCGNSGTTARLLMGYIAGGSGGVVATLRGDASLSKRPMRRVCEPLELMGATFSNHDHLPITITAAARPLPLSWELKHPSAQVKSAILLAALNAVGSSRIIEPIATRDHTENMLPLFGAKLTVADNTIAIDGGQTLRGCELTIPADPSSAAFLALAAVLCPNSEIAVGDLGANPRRLGFYRAMAKMGAKITLKPAAAELGGEPTATLNAASSKLKAITTAAADAPKMIDEYPALFAAAALADGSSRFCGLGELRLKESNRLDGAAALLGKCGVTAEVDGDDLIIHGKPSLKGGTAVDCGGDHRLAMAFAVLGLAADEPIIVKGAEAVQTSFPNFCSTMRALGAKLSRR